MKVKNAWAERPPFSWYAGEWHEGHILSAMGVPMATSFAGAAIVDGTTNGDWPLLWVLVDLLICAFVFAGHLLSGLNSIDNKTGQVAGSRYSYRGGKGSADLLRLVMKLEKKDQSLFPRDLPRTLSQNLLPGQREKINQGIWDTLKKIEERDKHLAQVEMKSIPTEHVLAALADAKSNVESDIQVYKEFL